jgi:hypothetical protein
MALYHSITIFSVVLIAVFAHGGGFGRHGGRGGGPPFLRNLTQDQRQAFFNIIKNENSTKAQIQTQLNTWAANISSDFAVRYFYSQQFFLATTELFIESGNVYIETKRNVYSFFDASLRGCCY